MARRICSDSGAPSRSLTTFRPAACSSSIQNEYRLRGVIGIELYIRCAPLATRHSRSITGRTHPSTNRQISRKALVNRETPCYHPRRSTSSLVFSRPRKQGPLSKKAGVGLAPRVWSWLPSLFQRTEVPGEATRGHEPMRCDGVAMGRWLRRYGMAVLRYLGLLPRFRSPCVTRFFGVQLMERVKRISCRSTWASSRSEHRSLSKRVHPKHPFVARTPTMRVPMAISTTDNVYAAMCPMLLAVECPQSKALFAMTNAASARKDLIGWLRIPTTSDHATTCSASRQYHHGDRPARYSSWRSPERIGHIQRAVP